MVLVAVWSDLLGYSSTLLPASLAGDTSLGWMRVGRSMDEFAKADG